MKKEILLSVVSVLSLPIVYAAQQKKPNILCIVCEDISPRLKCFGDSVAKTPNLDRCATESIRYRRMYTTVGVSSPSRAALITGMYPTAIGANYMRNMSPPEYLPEDITPYEVVLPDSIKCFTELMRKNGYYCTNNSKTDYQFTSPLTAWDEDGVNAHWKNRPHNMPFYSVFNLFITHESQVWERNHLPLAVNPDDIVVPPYFPDDTIVRHDMAVMYSNIFEMDRQFQRLYDELEKSGELDNTIIIWYSDNGGPLPMEKRSIYEKGMLVPFMIRFPDAYRAGQIDERMCMFPDIPATILSLAGIEPPSYMQGKPFLGKYETTPRKYVYGARNRMDEQIDKQASIRDKRYRLVINYNPEQSNYRPNKYRLQMPMMQRILHLLKVDSLSSSQMRFFVSPRSQEEFYDLEKDPYELSNQISNPIYKISIDSLRGELHKWLDSECKNWSGSEKESIEQMWPKGIQPKLKAPIITTDSKGIKISSPDKKVSFAYQINGKGFSEKHWFLYDDNKRLKLKKGDRLSVIAVRAGMKNSKMTEYIK
ncbi:sulfatase-like hydrolase/transferase [Paludibacter sp.]